jgi:hypothetical protein
MLEPGLLHRMITLLREPFNGRDRTVRCRRHRQGTRRFSFW